MVQTLDQISEHISNKTTSDKMQSISSHSTTITSPFLLELQQRNLLYQCTNLTLLNQYTTNNHIIGYIGFDATSDCLHVGHLSMITMLQIMQKHGHIPIILIGGGTTKIGDPTNRTTSRPMLSNEEITLNIDGLKNCLSKLIDIRPGKAIMVNNADWLDSLQYIPFLRDFGSHCSLNKMLSFETVKTRLASNIPMSFLEFNYPLLQAYDFLRLNLIYDCILQIGGSDQWGNIIWGIELGRKKLDKELLGLTFPLLLKSDGTKMGKTSSGAIWLSQHKTNVHDYWQYWRNVDDKEVIVLLNKFSDIPIDFSLIDDARYLNYMKESLANHMTLQLHGESELNLVLKKIEKTFGDNIHDMDIRDNIHDAKIKKEHLLSIDVVQLLVEQKLCQNKTEAHATIKGSGILLNNNLIQQNRRIETYDFINNILKVKKGKKKYYIILAI